MTSVLPDQGTGPVSLLSQPKNAWRQILALWDRTAIYMPLLMMGALALGTYWLVRNTPIFSAPEAVKAVSHEVDYFTQNFTNRLFLEALT